LDSQNLEKGGAVFATPEFKLFAVVFCALAVFVLFPHLKTGFTTNDDLNTNLMALNFDRFVDYPLKLAKGQGRFSQAVNTYLDWVPYLLESDTAYQISRLGPILVNTLLFAAVVSLFSGSSRLGLLSAVLHLSFLQNNWGHCLLTSYPFVFQFGIGCFFLSLLCFRLHARGAGKRWALWCGILYFLALLVSEAFVLYILVFACLSTIYAERDGVKNTVRNCAGLLIPALTPLVFFLVCYLAFRWFHPSQYSGNRLAEFSARAFLRVVAQFSAGTFPGVFFLVDPQAVERTFDGFGHHRPNLFFLLSHLKAQWIVKALLSSSFCAWIIVRMSAEPGGKKLWKVLALGILATILPLVLLGLTGKYQQWASQGVLAYVFSFFAFYGTVLVLGAILALCFHLAKNRRGLSGFALVFIGGLVALGSLTSDYYNHYVTVDQQLSQLKWTVVERFFQTDEFQSLKPGSILVAPSLWRQRGIVAIRPGYWSKYFEAKTGKKLFVAQDASEASKALDAPSEEQPDIYYLNYLQEPKSPNQLLVFAPLENSESRTAEQITIFSLSANKELVVFGALSSRARPGAIHVNGEILKKEDLGADWFRARVSFREDEKRYEPLDTEGKPFPSLAFATLKRIILRNLSPETESKDFFRVQIHSEAGIVLDSVTVSYYTNHSQHDRRYRHGIKHSTRHAVGQTHGRISGNPDGVRRPRAQEPGELRILAGGGSFSYAGDGFEGP
jgi:hypothetical protein